MLDETSPVAAMVDEGNEPTVKPDRQYGATVIVGMTVSSAEGNTAITKLDQQNGWGALRAWL